MSSNQIINEDWIFFSKDQTVYGFHFQSDRLFIFTDDFALLVKNFMSGSELPPGDLRNFLLSSIHPQSVIKDHKMIREFFPEPSLEVSATKSPFEELPNGPDFTWT